MIRLVRLPLALVILAAVGTAQTSRAQIKDGPREALSPAPAQLRRANELYDRAVYISATAERAGRQLEAKLEDRIVRVDRICGLTDAQEVKLRLAGRGDIKRLLDRAADTRSRLDEVDGDAEAVANLFAAAAPIRKDMSRGPFRVGSLFVKTLRTSLDEGQLARYDEAVLERVIRQYGKQVDRLVALMAEQAKLDEEQQTRLAAVLREEMPKLCEDDVPGVSMVVRHAVSLPAETLESILDDAKWRWLAQRFERLKESERARTEMELDEGRRAARASTLLRRARDGR